MEKCVDSDYTQTKHDSSKSFKTWTCSKCNTAYVAQPKNGCKACFKITRTRQKIAAHRRSVGRSDSVKHVANVKGKTRRQNKRTKPNVLNNNSTAVRQSVQKNTKIINSKVPDRLGKYVSTGVSADTKFLLNECSSETKITLNECSDRKVKSDEHSDMEFLLNECSETKLNMIGNECLSNKEAVSLSNSFESDSETKNIFEKFFDDCLGSTSLEKGMSSQETLNLEADDESVRISSKTVEKYNCLLENLENFKKDDPRMVQNEKTPTKINNPKFPNVPVKIKDHNSYYNHKKIRHVCEYCQKIFKSNGKLNSHVYSHTGERPFDCSNCGKAFSSKFKLVRHLLIHSEVRRFVCQICDRTFLRNDHLKNHYKVHDPQKKVYKCLKPNCEKEYSSLMSHKKHMAYHNVEDGDLKCLICGVKYESKEEVLFHLKSHSGSRLFKSQSDKKFKCEFCDRLFLTRKDVTRHLVVHTGERDFLCQFCPQRFGRKDHLVRHIKKSHVNGDPKVKTEIKKLMEPKVTKNRSKPEVIEKPKPESSTDAESSKEIVNSNIAPAESTSGLVASDQSKGDTNTESTPEIFDESITANTKSVTKEINTQTEECHNKTHILITVRGDVKNTLQKNRKPLSTGKKRKSFQKIESSVPNKKQVPLCKNKNSTTQILLQNIPNILIIPNNSIILLRNKSVSNKNTKKPTEASSSGESDVVSTFQDGASDFNMSNENLINDSRDLFASSSLNDNDSIRQEYNFNFNYDSNVNLFQPPQYSNEFPESDTFSNFQTDMPAFNSQFEEEEQLNFDMLNQSDLLKRPENILNLLQPSELNNTQTSNNSVRSETLVNQNLLSEASRQIRLLETGINNISSPTEPQKKIGIVKPTISKSPQSCEIEKDLFDDGTENLMLNESILNDFKEDESGILQSDTESGILNSIFNQQSDNSGNELLRNLLTSDNPVLSPLPGFSQIFHNSNANTNSS